MAYLDALLLEAKRSAPKESKPKEDEKAKPDEKKPEPDENDEKLLVETYDDVRIYRIPSKNCYYYEVPAPRYFGEERALIYSLIDVASNVINVDPKEAVTKDKIDKVYKEKILEIIEATPELKVPINSREFYADVVLKEMFGFGVIDNLVKDDRLEEIMIIGPDKPVYVFHRKYEMMPTNINYYADNDIKRLVDRIARIIGRRIDTQVPLLDARLPDGTRVNATLPPTSIDGATLTLRKFRKDPYTVIDLIGYNTINVDAAAFLWMATDGMGAKPANILIAGGTGSGKTTLLNTLCSFVPNTERIITIEDTAELSLPLSHWIRFETRPPGIEGTGEITMDMLVKNTLRMRPDRVIVGEIRGAEGSTMFTAMNTGHDGALSGDALVQISDGTIKSLEQFWNEQSKENETNASGQFEYVIPKTAVKVISWNKTTLAYEHKQVTHVWRKALKTQAVKITLDCGRKITATTDHPFYRIDNGIKEIAAGELKAGDFVAVPTQYSVEPSTTELPEPHFAGLLAGDGHLNRNGLQFVNADCELAETFAAGIRRHSSHSVSVGIKDGYTRVQVWDRMLAGKISAEYDLPFGNKTKTFTISSVLPTPDRCAAAFVRGLFDCEAHVNLHSNTIEFATSNPGVANTMPMALARFGVFASVHSQLHDGKGNTGPYYKVCISGRQNIEQYACSIGFTHQKKAEKLSLLQKSAKDALDLLPRMGATLSRLRKETKLSQAEFASILGLGTRSAIRAYETGARAPSKRALLAIASRVESDLARQLEVLAKAPIRWARLKSVEKTSCNEVYDLTVEDNHNYVANGIVVSNCFGTIHANSARETLTRITAPPVSVPEIMVGALTFIVVQKRIHDRRKGVIRRVTEIAEITPASEEKSDIEIIYQWDASKDVLEPTGVPPRYLQTLSSYTGLSRNVILEELEERKNILTDLKARGLRSMDEVCKQTQGYTLKKARKF
ncbi:MAG: ATPase, T2SS/T4P/T4SS family [Candidatus Micrarchaeia archaeon]|jgi:flagellar protein FlaI